MMSISPSDVGCSQVLKAGKTIYIVLSPLQVVKLPIHDIFINTLWSLSDVLKYIPNSSTGALKPG